MATGAHSTNEREPIPRIASDKIAPCVWFDLKIEQTCLPYGILLTASFGSHRFSVLGGKVDFGLKQAELHVEAIGGSIPFTSRWPNDPPQLETVIKRTVGQEQAATWKDGTHANAGANEKGLSAKIATDHEDGQEQRQSTQDEFDMLVRCITHSGSPTKPIWRFRAPPGQDYMTLNLNEQVIGQLEIDKKGGRATIDVNCEIMERFVRIIDSEGFLAGLATNSKWAVLSGLVRKAIFNQIKDCLGSIQLEAGSDGSS